jgi:hypothetical protein
LRAERLQPCSEFDNFKPRLKSAVSSNAFSASRAHSCGTIIGGFLNEEVKTYEKVPMTPLNFPTFFSVFTFIVWPEQT